MINKLIRIGIIISISFIYSQSQYSKATEKVLDINVGENFFEYLHFRFTIIPDYFGEDLTDIYYSIKYSEIGTNLNTNWVKLVDGHLINVEDRRFQWNGPFWGIRGITYKFSVELIKYNKFLKRAKVRINIYSSNPEADEYYYSTFNKSPFIVNAKYYHKKNAKLIHTFTGISTINSIYKIYKGINPTATIVGATVELVSAYVVDSFMKSKPINITIKCNSCGYTESFPQNDRKKIKYTCGGENCYRTAIIYFTNK